MSQSIRFYSENSLITDPGSYANFLDDLPKNLSELCYTIQGLLIHFSSLEASKMNRMDDDNRLFLVRNIIKAIDELDNSSFNNRRVINNRVVCTAREYALLLCSTMRHRNIPARLRAGFASYTGEPGFFSDHWICEFWDCNKEEWIKADAMLFNESQGELSSKVTPEQFVESGRAWQLVRNKKIDENVFGYEVKRGLAFIRSNMLRDFAALNKVELLPWSVLWGYKSKQEFRQDDYAKLDMLADLIVNNEQSWDQIQKIYHNEAWISGPVNQVLDQYTGQQALLKSNTDCDDNRIVLSDENYERRRRINSSKLQNFEPDPDLIQVKGAKQHNLKNIDISIPKNKLVVITGVSGSGKSSIAFDTIHSESQRRFMTGLSLYVRKYMVQMEKPKVDFITGLNPSVAIEQKTLSNNPRSTVGTITELSNYLRLLYSRVGRRNCTNCGFEINPLTPLQIAKRLYDYIPAGETCQLLVPLVLKRTDYDSGLYEEYRAMGYSHFRVNGAYIDLNAEESLPAKSTLNTIELVWGSYTFKEIDDTSRDAVFTQLAEDLKRIYKYSNQLVTVLYKHKELLFTSKMTCANCATPFPELSAQHFSANSPLGMCKVCRGLGITQRIEPKLLVEDESLSILDGALKWFGNLRENNRSAWPTGPLDVIYEHYGLDINTPWKDLPKSFHDVIFYGSGSEKISMPSSLGMKSSKRTVKGLVPELSRLYFDSDSKTNRDRYSIYMDIQKCDSCSGTGLCNEAYSVTLGGYRISEISSFSIERALKWVKDIYETINGTGYEVAKDILIELYNRFSFLLDVGLHYLTIDRTAPTLSGGEGQRVRLASQLSSGIVGVLYVLDEPSIGLHPKDRSSLIKTLLKLRDIGNSVLVVEHDEQIMREADWLIDIGPKAGVNGGELVSAGKPDEVMQDPKSLTGKYLSGKLSVFGDRKHITHTESNQWLTLKGATLHNLKNVTISLPIGKLTCVTGVSGSGKSSLIAGTLEPLLEQKLNNNASVEAGPYESIEGLQYLDEVINISQKAIGRTPRSNPATYTKLFDDIRKVFAASQDAKKYGLKDADFSFNSASGRCEVCEGQGQVKVEMHFLADVWVTCPECNGKRFNSNILQVQYKGKNISEVLDLDILDAIPFFKGNKKILHTLETFCQVGLDYIKLGQSATTFSGGEAQRIKLAKELSRPSKGNVVYVLDEPTTGLHFHDVQQLLQTLHKLVEIGNTVIIIEHNLDVVKTADWVIDVGPEGGDKGGNIVAQCHPKDLIYNNDSYTGQALKQHMEYFKLEAISEG
jgi:excinuclease ABC subunit A